MWDHLEFISYQHVPKILITELQDLNIFTVGFQSSFDLILFYLAFTPFLNESVYPVALVLVMCDSFFFFF